MWCIGVVNVYLPVTTAVIGPNNTVAGDIRVGTFNSRVRSERSFCFSYPVIQIDIAQSTAACVLIYDKITVNHRSGLVIGVVCDLNKIDILSCYCI